MPRLTAIAPEAAEGKSKTLLEGVKAQLGMAPNLMQTMAHSPAVLDAYLKFSGTLAEGVLSNQNREQIALTVGEANQCGYCLAAHATLGKMAGLNPEQITENRAGTDADPSTAALLSFSRRILEKKGFVSDQDVQDVRDAGHDDAAIAEVVANVALNIFTNYFNHVADTEIDFPEVEPLNAQGAACCHTEGSTCA
ncbi:carboxymuconolactone decarboxylase family protein [Gimesia fumaroli]|uniref:Carboxymuconolactone decarboxylase family protein n=1 Tax=Gimesia fumaroli TaxID=2527976 RepID=A0A518IGR1_9PLAN|nr:carboxymuconolactone decarboxylase family protein [Gimesia fumaroli]QDV52255.1 Carboxymuconolactone decarboxylase family protein [Gimesia fumaroli]